MSTFSRAMYVLAVVGITVNIVLLYHFTHRKKITDIMDVPIIMEKVREIPTYSKIMALLHSKSRTDISAGPIATVGYVRSKPQPSSTVAPTGTKKKYMIYSCVGTTPCAGWSDRQRGIVSVYFLSIITDRQFGIIMTKPCNVTQFYVPSEVNWIISKDNLRGKTEFFINDMGSRHILDDPQTWMNFNNMYPQDIVYIRTNNGGYVKSLRMDEQGFSKLPSWAVSNSHAKVFAKAWATLMRPSLWLQNSLDNYLLSINFHQRKHPFVCSHVRIARSETIPMDGPTRMNVSDMEVLWDFLDGYVQNGSTLFLATDSMLVRNMTRSRFGHSMTDTGGSIIHVDRQADVDGACEGFGSALLDQLILTYCDVLVLTRSGFGERAAYVRGQKENLFLFTGKKIVPLDI